MTSTKLLGSVLTIGLFIGLTACSDNGPTGPGGGSPSFILFASNRDAPSGLYGLFRMNLDGTNVQRLTNGGELFGSVDNSGNLLAFNTNDVSTDVFIKNLVTGVLTRVTNEPGLDYRPSLSKSGAKVAFVSDRAGGDREIWMSNADGTGLVRLTSRLGEDTFPQISPDEQRVVFTYFAEPAQTWIVNSNGTGLASLSNNSFEDVTPSFSADGSKILFSSNRDGDHDLFTMNLDGSGQTRLFQLAGNEYHASFTADGTQVVFLSDVTGKSQIMIANINGSNVRNLSNNNVNELRTAGLVPGGS